MVHAPGSCGGAWLCWGWQEPGGTEWGILADATSTVGGGGVASTFLQGVNCHACTSYASPLGWYLVPVRVFRRSTTYAHWDSLQRYLLSGPCSQNIQWFPDYIIMASILKSKKYLQIYSQSYFLGVIYFIGLTIVGKKFDKLQMQNILPFKTGKTCWRMSINDIIPRNPCLLHNHTYNITLTIS